MAKSWRRLEILIGVALSIVGALFLCYVLFAMVELMATIASLPDEDSSYLWRTLYSQIIIVCMIILPQLIGAILLICHKKRGWTLTLISCTNYIVILFLIGLNPYTGLETLWTINGIGFVLSMIIIALISKPYVLAYKPSIPNWLLIPAVSNLTFAILYIWL